MHAILALESPRTFQKNNKRPIFIDGIDESIFEFFLITSLNIFSPLKWSLRNWRGPEKIDC